jgi:hypothetical protein
MFFLNTPPRRRLPAFAGSVILHCALIVVLIQWSVKAPANAPRSPTRNYSVRFVHLEMPIEHHGGESPGASRSGASANAESARLQTSAGRAQEAGAAREKSEPATLAQPAIARETRRFQLPPNTRVQPVKQTLVQMDLPSDIVLKQEIPLPTVLLWTETKLPPPMRRQFVAPPVKKAPTITQSLPVALALDPPNQAIDVSNQNLASAIINDTPHLIHPPTIASPVSIAGQEPAKEIPQIGLANSSQPSTANLISQPNTPLRSSGILVLPPANQIAASDRASAGSSAGDGETGNTQHASGTVGHGVGGPGAGELAMQGKGSGGTTASGPQPGENGTGSGSSNRGSGLAGATASTGNGGGGTASVGNGGGTASAGNGAGNPTGAGAGGNGSELAPGNSTPGLTRIAAPKDGKFAVVVLGSADSTRYPESVGALSGKVVYTVYLRVGLRKSWILQYCLPKTAEKSASGNPSSTPLEAPWPFLILRPDRWSASDPDYVMVHGMITSAGQFDQVAMVFPDELDKKDLLLSSLKSWAFRPARRDGEPTAVEVLLIIPREVE